MSKPDRVLHEIARRIMKMRSPGAPATAAAAAESMQLSCGDLYRTLETLMGASGLQALLDRAIQITARDHPWLAAVKAGSAADCALSGLSEASEEMSAKQATEGCAALLATILWLLITLIGEDLTLRFVRHAWPNVPFTKLSEGSNE